MTPDIPETITYTEAAQRYNCDRQAIRRAVNAGRITAYKPGKEVRLVLHEADLWFYSTRIKTTEEKGKRRRRSIRQTLAKRGVGR